MIRPVHASGRQHGIQAKWASRKGRQRRGRPRRAGANDCQRGCTDTARKMGRSNVCVKKKRSALTMPFIVHSRSEKGVAALDHFCGASAG